jgi:hypothetical protein
MQVVKAETLLTVIGAAGEVAEIALHLGMPAAGGELLVILNELHDEQKMWLEEKMGINGLHDMMSILFEVVEEENI